MRSPASSRPLSAAWLLPCLLIAGCAASTPRVRQAVAQPPAPAAGPARAGTVADVREVELGADNGSRFGIDAVLAALKEPASPAALSLQEIVIDGADGPISLGGAYPNLAAGKRVVVIDGPSTTVDPGE